MSTKHTDEKASSRQPVESTQNRAIAKDAAIMGLPTLDPNDMPTPAQRRKWAKEYRDAQDSALKLIPAAKTATACQKTPDIENGATLGELLAKHRPQAQHSPLPQGTPVMCNGYRGAIVRHYDGAMYEIRLERGVTCTDQFEVIQPQAQHSPLPWNEEGGIITAGISPGQPYIADCRFGPAGHRNANARLIVASVNHAEALAEALRELFAQCAMTHKYWGENSNTNQAHIAITNAHEALARWEAK